MNTTADRSRKQPVQQQNEQQNGEQNAQNKNQKKTKQKKVRKPITLKPQNFQTEKGLKKLYQLTNQIKWTDSMPTQSAMNLVVMTLKSWQNQMMPKYYYDYFLQRCQALGSDKFVSAYMHKVRRIHKGIDHWDMPRTQNNPTQGNKNTQGIDLVNLNDNNQNYQDEAQQQQKFKQRLQLAKQMANTSLNKQPKPNKQNIFSNNPNQQQIDDMMDQDLRMFEQMSRKRNMKMGNNNNDKNNNNNNKNRQQYGDDQNDYENGEDLGGESGVMNDYDYYDD